MFIIFYGNGGTALFLKKENFEQRQYDNGSLDFLIKNNDWVEGESNGE